MTRWVQVPGLGSLDGEEGQGPAPLSGWSGV